LVSVTTRHIHCVDGVGEDVTTFRKRVVHDVVILRNACGSITGVRKHVGVALRVLVG